MIVSAPTATAGQIAISQTLDLTMGQLAPTYFTADITESAAAFSPIQKFDLAVGDTVVWDVDFTAHQALEVTSLHMPLAIFLTEGFTNPATVSMTGTLQFFAPDGSEVFALTRSDTNAALHVGQFFYGDIGPRPTFTFSAFRYSGVVTAYGSYLQSPAPLTRSYELPAFSVSGTSVRLSYVPQGGQGVVPEPAVWSLLILGFGVVGRALRRRQLGPI